MLDTMTLTKIVGSFCGALLVFFGQLGGRRAVPRGGGHGEDHAAGYETIVEEDTEAEEEVEETVDFIALMDSADADKGAKVFGKCKACHKLEDGSNGTGPHLYKIVGRAVGAAEGYGYSGALVQVADVWTIDALNGFLANPKTYCLGQNGLCGS